MPDYIVDTTLDPAAVKEAVDEVASRRMLGVQWPRTDLALIDSNTQMGVAVRALDPVPIYSVAIAASASGSEVRISMLIRYRGNHLRHLTDFVRALTSRLKGRARSGMGAPGYYMPPVIHTF